MKTVCSEVWRSASKSSLCNELTFWCSGQAFFSACNFLCNNFGSCGSLWAQVPYFPLVQYKKVTEAGSRSLCRRGIGLAPCYLDLAQPEFPCISVAPQWPGVFLWGKKVLWTFKSGWSPLERVKRMGSLGWKYLKEKTWKKANETTSLVFVSFVCKALASFLGVSCM